MGGRRFVYSIEGLRPVADLPLGGFGFEVYLDADLAKKAYNTLLLEGHQLNKSGEVIVRSCGLVDDKDKLWERPYTFVENEKGEVTTLLRYLQVPGNACDLGIDGSELSRLTKGDWSRYEIGGLEYIPHNVDNHLQAYALLSLFTGWANVMNAVLD